MKKVKRYNGEDNSYITGEDSNAGMKEAYDEGALERANSSAESQAIANEAKGEAMLKSMRDKATIAKPKAAPIKSTAKNPDYSNEGRSRSTTLNKSDYSNEGKRPVSNSARSILEEAKENVRRSNAARSSMAEASRPKMEVGRLPKKGPGLSNFKSGGSVSSRADGIAQRGKTKGRMC